MAPSGIWKSKLSIAARLSNLLVRFSVRIAKFIFCYDLLCVLRKSPALRLSAVPSDRKLHREHRPIPCQVFSLQPPAAQSRFPPDRFVRTPWTWEALQLRYRSLASLPAVSR